MEPNVWDLTQLFKGDDDPLIEKKRKIIERKSYEFINKWKSRTDYLKEPAVLKQALEEYEAWKRNYGTDGDEGYYFWLRTQQDQNDPALKASFNRIEDFSRKVENDIQFFYLRIGKIAKKEQKKFLGFPGLKKYRHFLERIFAEAAYLLSEKEERVLNLKTSTSYSNWVRMISSFLAKEEGKVFSEEGKLRSATFAEILSLMNSRSKKVRDSAAKTFNAILTKHADAAEAEVNSVLAHKKVDDELRKIPRPDLSRHIGDDIESSVVDSLVEAVSERFDISSRYYKLKAAVLGLKKLKYHERNIEYGEIEKKYTFEASRELITKVLSDLDPEFRNILSDFFEHGRFDVYPRKGKGSGAFCVHHLVSQPTFIFLNHTDKLNDVLTIAHELGHGINNELMRKKQHALNFGTPTSTAEVASTFMEDFVLQEIMKEADDEQRLSILMMKLNDDVSTIFRQIACYRFEQELHHEFRQRGYLAKEDIGTIFQKHMSSYMGDSVEQSPGSNNWWIYWSHIRGFFYVYSYASGLLISKALQNSVKRDHAFIEKVKGFLSAGLSDSPGNIFKKLGVDIADSAFWKSGLEEVEALLKETETLAAKLSKIS